MKPRRLSIWTFFSVLPLVPLLWTSVAAAQTGPAAKREAMQERMPQGNCPWGMGPGMMGGMGMMGGGMGMGSGMMGGGMGMMGMGPFGMLDLSDDQRAKLNKLQDEHRKKDWEIAGKVMDEQTKLRDLYDADTPDAKKIGAAYGAIAKLQQQAVEANVELHNRMQALLTKEQREQLKQWRRGMGPGMGPGPRGMMGR